jgi:hypothetical protein
MWRSCLERMQLRARATKCGCSRVFTPARGRVRVYTARACWSVHSRPRIADPAGCMRPTLALQQRPAPLNRCGRARDAVERGRRASEAGLRSSHLAQAWLWVDDGLMGDSGGLIRQVIETIGAPNVQILNHLSREGASRRFPVLRIVDTWNLAILAQSSGPSTPVPEDCPMQSPSNP